MIVFLIKLKRKKDEFLNWIKVVFNAITNRLTYKNTSLNTALKRYKICNKCNENSKNANSKVISNIPVHFCRMCNCPIKNKIFTDTIKYPEYGCDLNKWDK